MKKMQAEHEYALKEGIASHVNSHFHCAPLSDSLRRGK